MVGADESARMAISAEMAFNAKMKSASVRIRKFPFHNNLSLLLDTACRFGAGIIPTLAST